MLTDPQNSGHVQADGQCCIHRVAFGVQHHVQYATYTPKWEILEFNYNVATCFIENQVRSLYSDLYTPRMLSCMHGDVILSRHFLPLLGITDHD